MHILPWRFSVVFLKCFIEITVVAVSQHRGDFLNGQGGTLQKDNRPVHSFFQNDLGERLSKFLMEYR